MSMTIDKVPSAWNEGPFSGNGQIGHLLYFRTPDIMEGTLDHHLVWETRCLNSSEVPPSQFTEMVDAWNTTGTLPARLFDSSGGAPYRCRLPAVAYRCILPSPIHRFKATLDLSHAIWDVQLTLQAGRQLSGHSRLNSCTNVLTYHWSGEDVAYLAMVQWVGWDHMLPGLKSLDSWNLPQSRVVSSDSFQHLIQHLGDGRVMVWTCRTNRVASGVRWDMTAAMGDEESVLRVRNERLLTEYVANEEIWITRHSKDWQRFWARSCVKLPDPLFQNAYDIEQYKMYCNMRKESTPAALQGVFNHAESFPAWYGDLHNDFNVQACYWAAHRTNRSELAYPYARTYAGAIDWFHTRAERLFGVDGLSVPTCMDLNGRGTGAEYSYWNTMLGGEIFVAVDMCWNFQYTQDIRLLRNYIYPLVAGCVKLYRGIAMKGEDGCLHIPHTPSPELPTADRAGILFNRDSTFTIESLRYLCGCLTDFEHLLGHKEEEASAWQAFAQQLPDPPVGERGLQVFPGIDLPFSHRHFCHLFPIFPLNTLCRTNPSDREIMERSIQSLRHMGFSEFMPFSFTYLSIFAARLGWANMARQMVDLYVRCFRSPNTFAVNGDAYNSGLLPQGNQAGCDPMTFTLETGLLVITAIAEMLVHIAGGVLFVFPAVPEEWADAAFENLAVDGRHCVSAWRTTGRNRRVRIRVGRSGTLQISSEFMQDARWRASRLTNDRRESITLANAGNILRLEAITNDVIEFDREV